MGFDGLAVDLGTLYRLSDAQTRSASPENFTGAKGAGGMATEGTGAGCARDLGQGWKISPSVVIEPGTEFVLADIEGPGAIQHIWMTPTGNYRWSILRFYWDDQEHPSVEVPVGDFFAQGWGKYAQVNSLAVCVNPRNGFNCYWPMPFRRRCRITMTNLADQVSFKPGEGKMTLYYQVDYALGPVRDDAAYFHAQFRRTNPLPFQTDYTIVDGLRGQGHYVGTYLAWGSNNTGWWGEGEIKFFMDGDTDYPTICGTGTEDYFCGAYCYVVDNAYVPFSSPYTGMPEVHLPDKLWNSQIRFGQYRWHITDPIRFQTDLRVTIQALGWRAGGRYLPLQDDLASVAYWYQVLPTAPFPALPSADELEII